MKKQNRFHSKNKSQHGGVTLEYILICVFSIVSGMAALGYVQKIVKNKLGQMEAKMEDGAADWDSSTVPN